MIRALLFDFDGVVVDTEVATYRSWRDVYAEHGADLALEDWPPAVGSESSTPGAGGGRTSSTSGLPSAQVSPIASRRQAASG